MDAHPKDLAYLQLWHGCTVVAKALASIDWENNWISYNFTFTEGAVIDSYDVSLLGVDMGKQSTVLDTPITATPGMTLTLRIRLENL